MPIGLHGASANLRLALIRSYPRGLQGDAVVRDPQQLEQLARRRSKALHQRVRGRRSEDDPQE
jgi:hypothetical protein